MTKYLVSLLCSSNINIFKLSLKSAIEQINFDDYDIIVVINTLDDIFYNDIIKYIKSNKNSKIVNVIRTESNGWPGKGHNSLLNIFKNKNKYDNLVILDGDDFLYPVALDRINKIKEKTDFDVLTLVGNTRLIKNENYKYNDNKCSLNVDIEFKEIKNIGYISENYNNILATPMRIISINRKMLKMFNNKLYSEEMNLYDDYYYFLHFYNKLRNNDFKPNKNFNIIILNDEYIYLYNTINQYSLSKNYNEHLDDVIISEKIKNELNITNLQCEKLHINLYKDFIKDDLNKEIIDKFYKNISKNIITNGDILLNDIKIKTNSIDNSNSNSNTNNSNTNTNNSNNEKIKDNRKRILFVDLSPIKWNYNSIKHHPLGGTEIAMLYITEELSKDNNYNIQILTLHKDNIKINENLEYNTYSDENIKKFNPEIIVTQGNLTDSIINYKIYNKHVKIIMWMHHDITVGFVKDKFYGYSKSGLIDKYIFVSKWQQDRFIDVYNIDTSKCFIMNNGVPDHIITDIELLNNKINQNSIHKIKHGLKYINKKREIIYISSPYRGLIPAYYIFNQVKNLCPDVKFKVFSCFNRGSISDNNKSNDKIYKPLTKDNLSNILNNSFDIYYKDLYNLLIENENIEFYGSVTQDELFKHMETAMVLFYPNTYAETFCTSIIESMMYGCNVITSSLGAIPETSHGFSTLLDPKLDKVLDINYDTQNAFIKPVTINDLPREYIDNFIDKTIDLINNYFSNSNQELLKRQYEYVSNNCKWSNRLNILEAILNDL